MKKKKSKLLFIIFLSIIIISISFFVLWNITNTPVKNCYHYECFDEQWNNQYCTKITFSELEMIWDDLCQDRGYDFAISYDCENKDGVYTGPATEQFNDLILQCSNK